MTHSELVDLAVRWLRGSLKCSVVTGEMVSASCETPDAIGWLGARSTLVECKVSRADFLADRKKPHRINADGGMGCFRYFLAPARLIEASELPEGWGLLEPTGRGVRVVARSHAAGCYCLSMRERGLRWCLPAFAPARSEVEHLVSLLRRQAAGGVKGKARIHVDPYINGVLAPSAIPA